MKVTFTGSPQQIKNEMIKWLSNNQETTHNKTLEDNVSRKLNQHKIKLTQNENDVLPIGFVRQSFQLNGRDWKLFKHDLEACGVKEKRTSKIRLLTNLKLIEED